MNTIFSPKQKYTVIKNVTRYNFFYGTKMYRKKIKIKIKEFLFTLIYLNDIIQMNFENG